LLKNFLTEVQLLRKCFHKNIINLHEVHEDQDNVYLVLDYLTGPSVTSLLKLGKSVPESQLILILKDVASAISHIHSMGIIIRDINPRKMKLLKLGSPGPQNKVMLVGLTTCSYYSGDRSPTPAGTIGFIAPEVFNPDIGPIKANQPSRDIFSLGASIYYLATKCFPFKTPQGCDPIDANVAGVLSLQNKCWLEKSPNCKYRGCLSSS